MLRNMDKVNTWCDLTLLTRTCLHIVRKRQADVWVGCNHHLPASHSVHGVAGAPRLHSLMLLLIQSLVRATLW